MCYQLLWSPVCVCVCVYMHVCQMLPECCVIDDVYKPLPADSDSTLTKRRSFGDQYLLFSRQDTTDYMENNFPSAREPIRDMIVVQVDVRQLTLPVTYNSSISYRRPRQRNRFMKPCRNRLWFYAVGNKNLKPRLKDLFKRLLKTLLFIWLFSFLAPEYGWLTRPRLSCHIWKLIMQLGQPQPAFANREKSSVERVVRHVTSRMWCGYNWGRFSFTGWLLNQPHCCW